MQAQELLTSREALLEKFQAKGSWTFIRLPEIPPDKHSPFGWRLVKGHIDDYELNNCRLMPMGDGTLFMAVNATIRKAIKKQAGDKVIVELFDDNGTKITLPDLLECMEDEPVALKAFKGLSTFEQNHYLQHIHSAPDDEQKANRIVKLINQLNTTNKP